MELYFQDTPFVGKLIESPVILHECFNKVFGHLLLAKEVNKYVNRPLKDHFNQTYLDVKHVFL